MVIKTLPVGYLGANCYIVMDEESKECFILDPGGDANIIENEISKLEANVKFILLTHAHRDHMEAVEELYKLYEPKVLMHKEEEKYMELDNYVYGKMSKIYNFVDDGEELYLGKKSIKCIYTPGHTKGGMCFLIEDNLFTGDTLFNGSIGRTDFIGGDFNEIINSIQNKLMNLPNNTKVFPGHGPSSTVIYEKSRNPYLA